MQNANATALKLNMRTLLHTQLTGAQLAAVLRINDSDVSALAAAGVVVRSGGKYRLGRNVAAVVKHYKRHGDGRRAENKEKAPPPADDSTEALERRKLEAQIEAIEAKNVRILTEVKREAYREICALLTAQTAALRAALAGNDAAARALDDFAEGLADIDPEAARAEGGDDATETDS